ncbi:MAG: hydrogen peroxide-inducible genes activator [Pseudomonadota bacterium]
MPAIDRLTLRQLRYYVALSEHGSFRRAAERLEITQPTLTAQIAALEEILDVQLFERSRAGTALAPAGRELLADARAVLEQVQGIVDHAGSLSGGVVGTYRMGVTPTLGPYLLPHILPRIHGLYRALKLYVREAPPADLENELRDGRHDLVLTTLPLTAQDFTVVPLFREPLKLAMAREHRLTDRSTVSSQDLQGEEVLTIDEHHLFHRQISDLCDRLGATLRRDYEGTSLDTLRHMVVMGLGIAFLPALYVKSEIRAGDELGIVDVEGETLMRLHALAWRPTSPARGLFRELAVEIRRIIAANLSDDVLPVDW